ncbi:MAG: HAD family hydrolase [Clostridium sp.]|jgi:putative hydrolase of the HAD superfamily|uniref:HAD family hydrolase n=1 Tax=Clostridium sp. TaxID=1506 RepID=UPI0025BA492D|nr:HAD family hydrolase [Clostridium sp.]MCH3964319.1 HAD family hydrolase [Clostridium sp.]MCI1715494.1 HAD family hydrolase [Clostridium sp.]MCI1799714.1 HAD family hydrolase [Clostridium sp.]MCI1813678.1 HAD family hydrolase [Clostridium sp.]MCI1870527.1 HAD family hydrolase [Clostridium sp.]
MKAVVFDLDDTLYRERDFVEGAFRSVCSYLSQQHGISFQKLYWNTISILEHRGRGKIFDFLCDKYNIKENIDKLVNIYRNALPNIELYEDALYFLGKYRHKYSFGIITDGKASVQWNKIRLLKLEKYTDKIIVTDDYGKECWKPNSFAYLKMLQYFKCRPEDCMYIGDNPNKDFIGARKAGMNTVRIIRQWGDHRNTLLDSCHEADFNIRNLKELENIIENRM